MLTPISTHHAFTLPQSFTTQRTLSVTAAAPDASPVQTADDILDDLAARLEQDLDYQILRQSFDLESNTSLRLQRHTGAEQQPELVARTAVTVPAQVTTARSTQPQSVVALTVETRQQRTANPSLSTTQLEINIQTADPLALDLSGAGIATTGVTAGVQFDLDGDGQLEHISTVAADTWLLALDRNGNEKIDDGHELFGDQHGAAHGFAELARYDADAAGLADGVIDANDAVFSQLRLLQFTSTGAQVSQTLTAAGVTALELGYQNTRKALNVYDMVTQSGQFHRADGRSGETADIALSYHDLA